MRHSPGPDRNLLLFASHRGGSTWIMQVLGTQTGLRALNEPFSVYQGGALCPIRVPRTAAGHLISFSDSDEEARVRSYTDDLLSGALAAGAPTRFWARSYPRKSQRILIKDLHAKALIDWFDRNFDVEIIYLVRHPIPQAMSCIRNRWGASAYAYLRDPSFAGVLGSQLKQYGERVLQQGTPLEHHVLTWVLENYAGLRLLNQKPHWVFVSYEECVLEPDSTLQRVATRLNLGDVGKMRSEMNVPSHSSKMSLASTREQIRLGNSKSVLNGWRQEVSDGQERALLGILDRFEVPLYRPREDLPQLSKLNFGGGLPNNA